jgi:hypothetical protein
VRRGTVQRTWIVPVFYALRADSPVEARENLIRDLLNNDEPEGLESSCVANVEEITEEVG